MDIQYFALTRVRFISGFYEKALSPFVDIKRLIEEEKPPYEPIYVESEEPQFISEWIEADQSIDVLGIQCASLLCSTLKLFLEESLQNVFRRNPRRVTNSIQTESGYKSEFKKGWLNGYRILFENEFALKWDESNINLSIIEELILVRNRGQHPEHIAMMHNSFSKKDMEKIQSPFFVDDTQGKADLYEFIMPIIRPKPEKMRTAFEESIKLINWLDYELTEWGEGQHA